MSAAPLRVLVIDDEPPIRKLLRMGLTAQGYQVLEAPNGKAALELVAQGPDLVILDLGLPDVQGFDLLRTIRARNERVPIVVLSSRGDEAAKVAALDLGADDYVTKPFGTEELLARMRAALRHQLQVHGERPVFHTGDLSVDLVRRIAEMDAAIGGLPEAQRIAVRRDCPFIENGLCLAYRLRPLACRGHAAFDKEACIEAAAGENVKTAISTPHLVVRGLVQNAMMSALRGAGLSWGLYEFNRALHIASSTPDAQEKWIAGEDPLALAAIDEFDAGEAAATFDAIAGC